MKVSTLPVLAVSLTLVAAFPLLAPLPAMAQPGAAKADRPLPGSVAIAKLPADAREVADALASAKVGDAVVLRGRIAMVNDAVAKDRAAFTLSDDAAVAACCPKVGTHSDCRIEPANQVSVEVVDRSGRANR
jgi:hypothetical protein